MTTRYVIDWRGMEHVLLCIQIMFYFSAIVVTWLTYATARRGLLSPVNTEYQKRVIDRLASVSDELNAEFAAGAKNFYRFHDELITMSELIAQKVDSHRDQMFPPRDLTSLETRLRELVQQWRNDPFLPESIRAELVAFVTDRSQVVEESIMTISNEYWAQLKRGEQPSSPAGGPSSWALYYKVLRLLESRGFGQVAVADRLDELRLGIQRYLQRYDPEQSRRWPWRAASRAGA